MIFHGLSLKRKYENKCSIMLSCQTGNLKQGNNEKYGQSKELFGVCFSHLLTMFFCHQTVPMATVMTLKEEDSREVIVLTGPER